MKKLTSGDLRIARKFDRKLKFCASRDADSLEVYGDHRDENFSSDNEDQQERRELFTKCFDKKNIALGKMIKC